MKLLPAPLAALLLCAAPLALVEISACAVQNTASEDGSGAAVAEQATPVSVSPELKAQVAEKLAKTFRSFKFDDVKPSEVPGLYEVYSSSRIMYFAPQQDVLLFGEMYHTDGKSITAAKIAAVQVERAKEIQSETGVVVGDSGPEVLAFIDPDCGYCKRAHAWLDQQQLQGKIKEVIFFMPLVNRPGALAKAENLICAPPALRRAALDELWSATPADNTALLKCDDAQQKLTLQAEEAKRFGVVGTPTFVVKGQVVAGFDPARLETLLSASKVE